MSAALKAHVARLHLVRGLPKQEVAERVGLSRFKVARLLEQALAEGIVRIEIDEPVELVDDASRALEERHGIAHAIVVPEGQVARAAAAWLPEWTADGRPLGIAWGATLRDVASAVPAGSVAAVPVVQVCGAIPELPGGTGPVEIAARFAQLLGGAVHPLPAPALAGPRTRADLLRNPAVRPTVELFDAVGTVLVGVGVADRFPGAPAGAVGHVLTHLFDGAGRLLDDGRPAIAISAEQLRAARTVAVAAGALKAEAIRGALGTGLIDVLVTDEPTAGRVLS